MAQLQKTEQKLRAYLSAIHPQYEEAKAMGRVVFKPLTKILTAPDDHLAPRAAYLAALMDGDQSIKLIQMAAKHSDPRVRITAVYTLPSLPSLTLREALDLLMSLLADPDSHVVYRAIRSADKMNLPGAQGAITSLANYHPADYVRDAAQKALTSP